MPVLLPRNLELLDLLEQRLGLAARKVRPHRLEEAAGEEKDPG